MKDVLLTTLGCSVTAWARSASLRAAVESSAKLSPAAAAADDDDDAGDASDCCNDVKTNTIRSSRIDNIGNWRCTKYIPSRQNRADLETVWMVTLSLWSVRCTVSGGWRTKIWRIVVPWRRQKSGMRATSSRWRPTINRGLQIVFSSQP